MDTDTNQQINEFSKGMVADISDALLGVDQYRMAKNLRYVTDNEENTGELHMIEGSRGAGDLPQGDRIIASTQIRNIGVIVTKKLVDAVEYWRILRFDNPYENYIGEKDFRPIEEFKLVFQSNTPLGENLSLVTRYEDDENIKLYMTDGEHQLMVFNLAKFHEQDGGDLDDINSVVAYPSVLFKKPVFCGLINGTLRAGLIEYSYQFYTKYGHQSQISPSTKLIPLYRGPLNLQNTTYVDGYEQEIITDKGIRIRIDKPVDIESGSFTHIKVFRITYIENGQLPMIEVIHDRKMEWDDNNQIYIDDTGQKALEVFSLEEYNSMTGIHIIPKVIESKGDCLFASNIREQEVFVDEEIKDWDAHANVTYELVTQLGIIGDITSEKKITLEGVDDTISFDSISLTNGDTISFADYVDTETVSNVPNYKNPAVSYTLKSLKRDEKYRYGIILYDKDGNASPVKHIADIDTPTIADNSPYVIDDNKLIARPMGVKFTVSNIPEAVVAYEIVRCGRTINDIKNISQGVIASPVKRLRDARKKEPYTPSGFLTTGNVWMGMYQDTSAEDEDNNYGYAATNYQWAIGDIGAKGEDNNHLYQFVSPEVCYTKDTFGDMINHRDLKLAPVVKLNTDYGEPVEDDYNTGSSGHTVFISDNDVESTYNLIKSDLKWLRLSNEDKFQIPVTGRGLFLMNNLTTIQYYNDHDADSRPPHGTNTFSDIRTNFEDNYLYIKLYTYNAALSSSESQPLPIEDIKTAEDMRWNEFVNSTTIDGKTSYATTYQDKLTQVGNDNYCNYVVGGMYGVPYTGGDAYIAWQYQTDTSSESHNYLNDGDSIMGTVIGPGGRCAVLNLENTQTRSETVHNPIFGGQRPEQAGVTPNYLETCLCNLQQNVIPYGGNTDVAISTSSYNSYGDYFVKEGSVQTSYVFDGDCYIQPFEYISQHKCYTAQLSDLRTICIAYAIPVETNINLAYTYGYELSKNISRSSGNITNLQVEADNVFNKFTQSRDLYLYNSVYSVNNNVEIHAAELDEDNKDELNTDYRTYHSNKKENNERIDSWLKFMPANYLDVDTRYGGITGLRKFHNDLIFWQEEATGKFSVEERTTLTDESNMPLILGSGGVLSRYDYLATSNGMHKDEFCDAQSDSTLYWWDHNKHELLAYGSGLEVVPFSKTKLIQNMLNDSFNKKQLSDKPKLAFDKRYNELLAHVDQDRTIVYSEIQQAFQAVYDIKLSYAIQFAGRLYLTNNGTVYEWNQIDGAPKGFRNELYPYLKYIVNQNSTYTKVFDNQEFGGRIYGGDDLDMIDLTFATPLKQESHLNGREINNREYNFRYAIPRHEDSPYGDRMRGKTMQCELKSSSNDYDFSLQWIKTKFRISWS